MARKEFSRSVKVAVVKRAMRNGEIYCEECHSLAKGRFEIDHVRADGLLGEPTLENAKLLCRACHVEKTASDVAAISKAKRREAKALGIKKSRFQLKSKNTFTQDRGSSASVLNPSLKIGLPPRRMMFVDDTND
jgi:hypothetical protein